MASHKHTIDIVTRLERLEQQQRESEARAAQAAAQAARAETRALRRKVEELLALLKDRSASA